MSDGESRDRVQTHIYFWCGLVVGGIFGAGIVMPGHFASAWIDWGIVVAIGIAFGWASARWGDAAWVWLSDRVRLPWSRW